MHNTMNPPNAEVAVTIKKMTPRTRRIMKIIRAVSLRIKIDLTLRRVWLAKKEVRLSPLQYTMLAALVRNAGRVVAQKQLLKEIWPEGGSTPEALRILVHQTRHRIEREPVRPRHLKTEPGVGYRLEAPDE